MRRGKWKHGGLGWLYAQAFIHRQALAKVPAGGLSEFMIFGIVAMCIGIVWTFARESAPLRDYAVSRMREVAAQPLPSSDDPRLKKGDFGTPSTKREYREVEVDPKTGERFLVKQ
jgi:hypothetical protein